MNCLKILPLPSLLLGKKEQLSARKTLKRGLASSHSPLKGRVLGGTLGAALVILVVLVVLVACPATPSGGGGTGYLCANGTPSSLRDATADGLSRCASCNSGFTLANGACLPAYVCVNGTPAEGTTDTAGQTRCASCNLLYRLDGTTDVVGRSCGQVAVGEATRIGMANLFGMSETIPYGLAAIGTILYMVGDTNDILYTLDTTTGGVAQVGSTDAGFGVSETNPRGLAVIGNTLYIVIAGADSALYTLSTTTGGAARVSDTSVIQFGEGEFFPTGLAAINDTLYMVGDSNDALYTLDTTTGRATRMSAAGVSQFGVGEMAPAGLAAIGNTLYMVGIGTDALYTLNIDSADSTADGTAIPVGSGVTRFGINEDNPTGLAAIGSTLYMVGQDTDALYALRYQ